MQIQELYNNLKQLDSRNNDIIHPFDLENIKIGYDSKVFLKVEGRKLYLSQTAYQQICERLGVPSYFLGKQDSELQALIITELMKRRKSTDVLLRTREDNIRAILSKCYSIYNHSQLAEALSDYLSESYTLNPYYDSNGDVMTIRIAFTEKQHSFSDSKYITGIFVINSETGQSSIAIKGYIFRVVCTNGAIVATNDMGHFLRQFHRGINSFSELNNKVYEAINESIEVTKTQLTTFQHTKEITVDKPYSFIEQKAKKISLSNDTVDSIKNKLAPFEPDISPLFDIINAFTSTARELQDPVKSDIEAIAGSMIVSSIRR